MVKNFLKYISFFIIFIISFIFWVGIIAAIKDDNEKSYYKEILGISLGDPKEEQNLYSEGIRDTAAITEYKYDKENMTLILNESYWQKCNTYKLYLFVDKYNSLLTEKGNKILKDIVDKSLNNEKNCFSYFEYGTTTLLLLISDIDSNAIYKVEINM